MPRNKLQNNFDNQRCINCVNLIQMDEKIDSYDCDYDVFSGYKKQDVELLTAIVLECAEFFDINDL